MLTITKNGGEYVATCGRAQCTLPIIERRDPESGQVLTEAVSASGIRGLFRTAVDVTYVPVNTRAEDGSVSTTYVPRHQVYDTIEQLLTKLANERFGSQFTRISRMANAAQAGSELESLMGRTINLLAKEAWDPDGAASYETYANNLQAIVLDGQLPRIRGRFLAEVDAHRRLEAAKALTEAGLLSSPCATGAGDPGKSYYLTDGHGYTVTELANPLVSEMPEKRRGVTNAVKNAVEIVCEEPSRVHLKGVTRTPPMTSAAVVCLPLGLDDSVIISQSLADRLTARVRRSNWHNIDGVVNYRGGYRPTGRNGRLVKRAAEWPLWLERSETDEGHVAFTPCPPGMNGSCQGVIGHDGELLMAMRREYETHWHGLIQRLGAYSAEECAEWKCWLSHQPRWTQRKASHTIYTRYAFGVERVLVNGGVMYREDLGWSYRKGEVGMKVQSDGDLFKGVVSRILPDKKMPLAVLGGKLVRAEVVCEMNGSAARHGSLRFAHGQMALYALARHHGGMEIGHSLTTEDVARMAVAAGVYADDTLTCEVFDSTGTVSYGRFPAGVTRVCRHKQDPSVVSAVKGHHADRPWMESNSVRSGGCVSGIADTACMLAAGLTECARELRSEIPSGVMLRLELLRNAIA